MTRMNTQTMTQDQATFVSLSEFARANSFVQTNQFVSVNKNGYPFITFLTDTNLAENIYFGSSIADQYPEGTPITRAMLSQLQIRIGKKDGETRIKLVSKNCGRQSLSDLL